MGPDGYASSWLAIPDALEQFSESLGDDVVAVAKSRDSLRLIDASNRLFLRDALERVIEEYQDEPRQLSPLLYRIGNGEMTVWVPPPDDPCYPLVIAAHAVLAATE